MLMANQGVRTFPGNGKMGGVEEELRRLRDESRRLKMEREIFKKRGAFFARKRLVGKCAHEKSVQQAENETIHKRNLQTRAQVKAEIIEWIEMFYNGVCLHSELG